MGNRHAGDIDVLRHRLLSETVARSARSSRLYGDLYAEVDVERVRTTRDLARLPLVDRALIAAAGADAMAADRVAATVQYTSGTTGRPLLLQRSPQELAFIRDFFATIALRDGAVQSRRLMLVLVAPNHGASTPVPGTAFVLQSAVSDDEMLLNTVDLLTRQFDFTGVDARVSLLAGPAGQVAALTAYAAAEAGFESSVRDVHMTGMYITRRWRDLIGATWSARPHEHYSLSEIFGGATRCRHCDEYHFEPFVVAEVVDPATTEPIDDGVGILVLTSLYPFVQRQPMIRYVTDDVFRVKQSRCSAPGFEYLGRRPQCLSDPENRSQFLVYSTDLLETLDAFLAVNRTEGSRHLTLIRDKKSLGEPIARGYVGHRGATLLVSIDFEVVAAPFLFAEGASLLAQELRDQLLARSPILRRATADGRVAVEFRPLPPGSIHAPAFTKEAVFWTDGTSAPIV